MNEILHDKEFNSFREIIYTEAGIRLNDHKKALVQARLARRLRLLGLATYAQYHAYLVSRFDQEKVHFINAITTNKTEFFRENKHFEYMKTVALPQIERSSPDEIRIWSAGCSTGEEPYTIAITMLEYFGARKAPGIKILATDIDTQVLEKAQKGLYSEDQVGAMPAALIKKYFSPGMEGRDAVYEVKDEVKKLVFFRHLNLRMEEYPMQKQFDIIFCRNVIIYFDKVMQAGVFRRFYSFLKDSGFLMIGHSENISNISNDFMLIGNTIYKKVV
ncbi:MAG TPA: protein-glutamate O-methyltransferase CheR [Spirochaetota bacterium]|nr:protein-glutamate O-methyltransferase CheR [Spirochaetota bacterium]HRZ27788.1 protein-glutamate O-methyltransferase CheR [Spirochaetota bacterium]HSA13281.1 protein-glutamate O-methyltransferase CheR [Spirochaetota bacterium]